eukprot:3107431-Pyramimonas_sp.AAC.1
MHLAQTVHELFEDGRCDLLWRPERLLVGQKVGVAPNFAVLTAASMLSTAVWGALAMESPKAVSM